MFFQAFTPGGGGCENLPLALPFPLPAFRLGGGPDGSAGLLALAVDSLLTSRSLVRLRSLLFLSLSWRSRLSRTSSRRLLLLRRCLSSSLSSALLLIGLLATLRWDFPELLARIGLSSVSSLSLGFSLGRALALTRGVISLPASGAPIRWTTTDGAFEVTPGAPFCNLWLLVDLLLHNGGPLSHVVQGPTTQVTWHGYHLADQAMDSTAQGAQLIRICARLFTQLTGAHPTSLSRN